MADKATLLKSILDQSKSGDRQARDAAWSAFGSSASEQDFYSAVKDLPLDQSTKRQMWMLKFPEQYAQLPKESRSLGHPELESFLSGGSAPEKPNKTVLDPNDALGALAPKQAAEPPRVAAKAAPAEKAKPTAADLAQSWGDYDIKLPPLPGVKPNVVPITDAQDAAYRAGKSPASAKPAPQAPVAAQSLAPAPQMSQDELAAQQAVQAAMLQSGPASRQLRPMPGQPLQFAPATQRPAPAPASSPLYMRPIEDIAESAKFIGDVAGRAWDATKSAMSLSQDPLHPPTKEQYAQAAKAVNAPLTNIGATVPDDMPYLKGITQRIDEFTPLSSVAETFALGGIGKAFPAVGRALVAIGAGTAAASATDSGIKVYELAKAGKYEEAEALAGSATVDGILAVLLANSSRKTIGKDFETVKSELAGIRGKYQAWKQSRSGAVTAEAAPVSSEPPRPPSLEEVIQRTSGEAPPAAPAPAAAPAEAKPINISSKQPKAAAGPLKPEAAPVEKPTITLEKDPAKIDIDAILNESQSYASNGDAAKGRAILDDNVRHMSSLLEQVIRAHEAKPTPKSQKTIGTLAEKLSAFILKAGGMVDASVVGAARVALDAANAVKAVTAAKPAAAAPVEQPAAAPVEQPVQPERPTPDVAGGAFGLPEGSPEWGAANDIQNILAWAADETAPHEPEDMQAAAEELGAGFQALAASDNPAAKLMYEHLAQRANQLGFAKEPEAPGESAPASTEPPRVDAPESKEVGSVAQDAPPTDVELVSFNADRGGFAEPARMIVNGRQVSPEEIQQQFFPDYPPSRLTVQKLRQDDFFNAVTPHRQHFVLQFRHEDGRHSSAPAGIEKRLGLGDSPATGPMPSSEPPRVNTAKSGSNSPKEGAKLEASSGQQAQTSEPSASGQSSPNPPAITGTAPPTPSQEPLPTPVTVAPSKAKAEPVAAKPETNRDLPERRRFINRGKHDRVLVRFPGREDSAIFDAVGKSRRNAEKGGSWNDLMELSGNAEAIRKYDMSGVALRQAYADYHEAVREIAKAQPKTAKEGEELEAEVPSFEEFMAERTRVAEPAPQKEGPETPRIGTAAEVMGEAARPVAQLRKVATKDKRNVNGWWHVPFGEGVMLIHPTEDKVVAYQDKEQAHKYASDNPVGMKPPAEPPKPKAEPPRPTVGRSEKPVVHEPQTAEKAEQPKETYDYSSTQYNLPEKLALRVRAMADEIDAADVESKETEPHVKILSGIKDRRETPVGGTEDLRSGGSVALGNMVRLNNDLKVLDPIIRAIPIEVVNVLGGQERTAQVLLHDQSMLVNALSALTGGNVPSGVVSNLVPVIARRRAELTALGSGLGNSKYLSALDALYRNLGISRTGPTPPEAASKSVAVLKNIPSIAAPRAELSAASAKLASDGDESGPAILTNPINLGTDSITHATNVSQYGKDNTGNSSLIDALRALLADQPPIKAVLGNTSVFPASESGSSDVVKIDVGGPDLHALNKKIADALPHTSTHPTYQPHITVAYVEPGTGQKYAGDDRLAGKEIVIDKIVFSGKNGDRVVIPLAGKPNTEPPRPKQDNRSAKDMVLASKQARNASLKEAKPIFDAADSADAEISSNSAASKALDRFFGGDKESLNAIGMGVWGFEALEKVSKDGGPEWKAIESAFSPVRQKIRDVYGNSVRLFRSEAAMRDSGLSEEDKARTLFSYTLDPYYAGHHAAGSLAALRANVPTEDAIQGLLKEYAENGKVVIDFGIGKHTLVRSKDDPDLADIYDGEEYITDTEPEEFIRSEAKDLAEKIEKRDKALEKVVARDIPVDDIVWVTNRGNQHEFVVRQAAAEAPKPNSSEKPKGSTEPPKPKQEVKAEPPQTKTSTPAKADASTPYADVESRLNASETRLSEAGSEYRRLKSLHAVVAKAGPGKEIAEAVQGTEFEKLARKSSGEVEEEVRKHYILAARRYNAELLRHDAEMAIAAESNPLLVQQPGASVAKVEMPEDEAANEEIKRQIDDVRKSVTAAVEMLDSDYYKPDMSSLASDLKRELGYLQGDIKDLAHASEEVLGDAKALAQEAEDALAKIGAEMTREDTLPPLPSHDGSGAPEKVSAFLKANVVPGIPRNEWEIAAYGTRAVYPLKDGRLVYADTVTSPENPANILSQSLLSVSPLNEDVLPVKGSKDGLKKQLDEAVENGDIAPGARDRIMRLYSRGKEEVERPSEPPRIEQPKSSVEPPRVSVEPKEAAPEPAQEKEEKPPAPSSDYERIAERRPVRPTMKDVEAMKRDGLTKAQADTVTYKDGWRYYDDLRPDAKQETKVLEVFDPYSWEWRPAGAYTPIRGGYWQDQKMWGSASKEALDKYENIEGPYALSQEGLDRATKQFDGDSSGSLATRNIPAATQKEMDKMGEMFSSKPLYQFRQSQIDSAVKQITEWKKQYERSEEWDDKFRGTLSNLFYGSGEQSRYIHDARVEQRRWQSLADRLPDNPGMGDIEDSAKTAEITEENTFVAYKDGWRVTKYKPNRQAPKFTLERFNPDSWSWENTWDASQTDKTTATEALKDNAKTSPLTKETLEDRVDYLRKSIANNGLSKRTPEQIKAGDTEKALPDTEPDMSTPLAYEVKGEDMRYYLNLPNGEKWGPSQWVLNTYDRGHVIDAWDGPRLDRDKALAFAIAQWHSHELNSLSNQRKYSGPEYEKRVYELQEMQRGLIRPSGRPEIVATEQTQFGEREWAVIPTVRSDRHIGFSVRYRDAGAEKWQDLYSRTADGDSYDDAIEQWARRTPEDAKVEMKDSTAKAVMADMEKTRALSSRPVEMKKPEPGQMAAERTGKYDSLSPSVNVSLPVKPLKSALTALGKLAKKKTVIPILNNAALVNQGGKTQVIVTDLETAIQVTLDTGAKEDGAVTIPFAEMASLVKGKGATSIGVQTINEGRASISDGVSKVNVETRPITSYPEIPETSVAVGSIDAKTLKKAFEYAAASISTAESRFTLNAALLKMKGGQGEIVSTNGHSLLYHSFDAPGVEGEGATILVPLSAMSATTSLVGKGDSVAFSLDSQEKPSMIGLEFGSVKVATRKPSGNFPDYERVMPDMESFVSRIVVSKVALADLMSRALSAAKTHQTRSNATALSFRNGQVSALVGGEGQESKMKAWSSLEVIKGEKTDTFNPANPRIGVDASYVSDFLDATPAVDIEILIKDERSALVMRPAGDPRTTFVLMPMRDGAVQFDDEWVEPGTPSGDEPPPVAAPPDSSEPPRTKNPA